MAEEIINNNSDTVNGSSTQAVVSVVSNNSDIPTDTTMSNADNTGDSADDSIDPIQEAYNNASYDVKKFLEGEEFPRIVELIIQANKLEKAAISEVNFICLSLTLKILPYNSDTKRAVVEMLQSVGVAPELAQLVWQDIETYVIPSIPEILDTGATADNVNVERVVNVDESKTKITHFGPESVEMRLKNIGAPRITLDELTKGESLLQVIKKDNKPKVPRPINYNTHPDPYREEV